jgi:hypothetical protein
MYNNLTFPHEYGICPICKATIILRENGECSAHISELPDKTNKYCCGTGTISVNKNKIN